jgi:hypothetical protein
MGAGSAAGLGGIGTASAIDPVNDTDEEFHDGLPEEVSDAELQASAERVPLARVEDRTETVAVNGFPERAGGIRPGSQMLIELSEGGTAGCTANFIWRDNQRLYIGAAGHCFLGQGDSADNRASRQHEDGANPNQTIDAVKVCADCTFGGATGLVVQGATIELGRVVYARQTNPVEDDNAGVGHDFGLVEIKQNQEEAVDPSMPQFGGPNGVSEGAIPPGQPINQYGAGVGNGEVYATQGSNGASFGDGGTDDEAWFAAIRASPGDSGSPIQSSQTGSGIEGDEAGGILTHLTTLGTAGTTIGRCKEMVAEDINRDIEVVKPGDL